MPAPESPLVSGIIIFLNEERYLAEAIESVVAQTYGNWELLLIDDGSSDRSAEIAKRYAGEHERIRYLTHPGGANRGMSASRNLGLAHATGEFVAFLDGDDSWLDDKLERQLALFSDHPDAQLVCGATIYWNEWDGGEGSDRLVRTGEIMSGPEAGACVVGQDRLYRPPELMTLLYPLGRGVTPSMSGMMARRLLLTKVGGFEAEFRGLFEDQVIRVKAHLAGPIYVSGQCFDRYRQHAASCCHSTRSSLIARQARRHFFAWLAGYLNHVGCRNREIRRAVRLQLLRNNHPRIYHWRVRLGRVLTARR